MAHTPTESQQLGRIEANVHILVKRGEAMETRVTTLERGSAKIKGALGILSLLFTLGCAYMVAGCAHYHSKTYGPDGALLSSTVSTVVGTGNTSFIGPTESYTTTDTGLSDNGKEAISDAVEAGVRAALPLP